MPYRVRQIQTAPTALQKAYGRAWLRASGLVKDFYLERAKQAVKLRFPSYATPDALGAIGDERLIDRAVGPQLSVPETDGEYSARLRNAWGIWYWGGTAFGMLTALAAQGYTGAVLIQQNGVRWSLSGGALVIVNGPAFNFPAPNLWSTFLVLLPTVPSSWTDIVNPPTPTSSPDANEIARLIRIINLWRPGHMTCAGLRVVISGRVWGHPVSNVWGTGTWGGVITNFDVPPSPIL